MHEKAIRDVIEKCYRQHGWPPSKIAVTQVFFNELWKEVVDQFIGDPSKTIPHDLVFGGNTRVYTAPIMPPYQMSTGIIAWEVSPNRAYQP